MLSSSYSFSTYFFIIFFLSILVLAFLEILFCNKCWYLLYLYLIFPLFLHRFLYLLLKRINVRRKCWRTCRRCRKRKWKKVSRRYCFKKKSNYPNVHLQFSITEYCCKLFYYYYQINNGKESMLDMIAKENVSAFM